MAIKTKVKIAGTLTLSVSIATRNTERAIPAADTATNLGNSTLGVPADLKVKFLWSTNEMTIHTP